MQLALLGELKARPLIVAHLYYYPGPDIPSPLIKSPSPCFLVTEDLSIDTSTMTYEVPVR